MESFLSEFNIDKELLDLFDAYCNGTASSEKMVQLEESLASDPRAMDAFVAYTDLHARLHRWAQRASHTVASMESGELPCGPCVDDSILDDTETTSAKESDSKTPILGFLGDIFQEGAEFFSRGFVLTLLLAIGLPGTLLLVLMIDIARQPVATVPLEQRLATVAAITRESGCHWGKTTGELAVGARLHSGQRLHLHKGLVEFTFDNGADVILQGPAILDINSGKEGLLQEGKLIANVPKKAAGFTIDTPTVTVIDLGTEFGISVDAAGNSEAHVFTGQVEVGVRSSSANATKKFELLKVGQAARIEKTNTGNVSIKPVALAPRRFVRRLPPETNLGLPEPTILYSHHGNRDPVTEGWELYNQSIKSVPLDNVSVSPIQEDKTPAWHIKDSTNKIGVHYRKLGLPRNLIKEGKKKGWVMRARVKVSADAPTDKPLAFYSYWLKGRKWALRLTVGKDGNQRLILHGNSSLGNNAIVDIPNSRDTYIDYEIRYCPKTHDADVYINGKLAATGYYKKYPLGAILHFGTFEKHECEASFARVEWGIIRQD